MSTHKRRIDWRTTGRTAGTVAVVAILGLLTLALLAAAGASSYDNLFHLAASRSVPIPHLSPLEIDGGLVVVIVLDIMFTWRGCPLGGLRLLARILGVGTIVANVMAGWPDPVGASLRAFAPAIIVAVTEALRAFLLRRHRDEDEKGIPFARWMLAPWPTFVLWRRMKLWDIPGYRTAVDMELSRRQAIVKLEMHFGAKWKTAAPADLVWMLRGGVRMTDALTRVAKLTGSAARVSPQRVSPPPAVPQPVPPGTDGDTINEDTRTGSAARRGSGSAAPQPAQRKSDSAAPKPRARSEGQTAEQKLGTEAAALSIIAEEPNITGSELGRRLGTTPGYGRTLMRKLSPAGAGGDS